MVLFEDALTRLAGTDAECMIFTPYGQTRGVVLELDGDCFKFLSVDGQIFTLFIEDLVQLVEGW